jgi:hypothetical protein
MLHFRESEHRHEHNRDLLCQNRPDGKVSECDASVKVFRYMQDVALAVDKPCTELLAGCV